MWPREIFDESRAALWANVGVLAHLLCAAGVVFALGWFARNRPWLSRTLWSLTLVGAIGVGLYRAWHALWLCDDAFITFRYSDNFARGFGLVFIPGEWVEGYTNFLWAVTLGLLGKLGIQIPFAGLMLNLLAFAIAVAAVAVTVARAAPGGARIPWGAIAVASSLAFVTFASSGLETMPAAMFVALGMLASTSSRVGAPLFSSVMLVCAAMSRPDHILYGFAMGLGVLAEALWERRAIVQRAAMFAGPWLLIFVPYWLIRWRVYGDFYPNTYYAKSGGEAYWSQGGIYVIHFLTTTGAWAALPLLVFAVAGRPQSADDARLRTMGVASTLFVTAYVAKVGGDFMQWRFFVGLIPVLAVTIEVALRSRLALAGLYPKVLAGLGLVSVALVATPVRIIGPMEKKWHLAAEDTFYPVASVWPLKVGSMLQDIGEKWRAAFADGGLAPRIAVGCVGMIAYYSRVPIVDTYGLASRRVAHRPLSVRGRPGHEKRADNDDLWAERTLLSENPYWADFQQETSASLGIPLWFVQWDEAVAKAIRKAGGAAPDVDADIARFAATSDRGTAVRALTFYRTFLALDPHAEQRLEPLVRRLGSIADFEDQLPAGAVARGFEIVKKTPLPEGATGAAWLASHDQGRFELRLPAVPKIRFELGGPASAQLSVSLVAEGGEVLEKATPSGAATQTVEWSTQARPVTLVAVDDDPAADMWIDGLRSVGEDEDRRLEALSALAPGQMMAVVRQLEKELPANDARLRKLEEAVTRRWSFEGDGFGEGVAVAGTAWGTAPEKAPLPNQTPVSGAQGAAFANSYHGGDAATGTLTFELPEAESVSVNALVGGGDDCAHTALVLRVGRREVARACGRKDEVLRPATLSAHVMPGERASLQLVDQSSGPWGHLLVDDIMVSAAPARPLR